LIDEIPPIVLIKPVMEELHTTVLQEEEALNTKKMLRKLKRKEKLSSKTHKEGALSSKKMHRKMEAVETPIKTLSLISTSMGGWLSELSRESLASSFGIRDERAREREEKKVKSKKYYFNDIEKD
jgi:hypothetical protein